MCKPGAVQWSIPVAQAAPSGTLTLRYAALRRKTTSVSPRLCPAPTWPWAVKSRLAQADCQQLDLGSQSNQMDFLPAGSIACDLPKTVDLGRATRPVAGRQRSWPTSFLARRTPFRWAPKLAFSSGSFSVLWPVCTVSRREPEPDGLRHYSTRRFRFVLIQSIIPARANHASDLRGHRRVLADRGTDSSFAGWPAAGSSRHVGLADFPIEGAA
jgi:hypothetical protein